MKKRKKTIKRAGSDIANSSDRYGLPRGDTNMGYGNGGSYGAATSGTYAGEDAPMARMPQPQRQSHTGDQMMRLEKGSEALHMVLSELEGRLNPILQPDTPAVDKIAGNPSLPVSFAQVLCSSNDRIDSALRRLQSIIARIDL